MSKDKDYTFNPGVYVVYPAHGVGQVSDITSTSVGGQELELIAVSFNKDKLVLKIPMSNAEKTGLRQIASPNTMTEAESVLKSKAKVRRIQWNRRAQEYDQKIKSGNPVAIAEVIRDVYKHPTRGEQTYSERQIYEQAMGRLAAEYATINNINEKDAMGHLENILFSKIPTTTETL